ncbi:aromatic ring-hydroxylating oxygenase subunit alpha [Aerosakkonema funiforme]|uniref:aromatic ring-hydroxylating oxygenase subunit alpha n=1 Tax=Aerosakkonema funiforme TaxID=1246630 RepID=UPI0035B74860
MTSKEISVSQSVADTDADVAVPGYWYTAPNIFNQEREKIWYKSWLFAGRLEKLANPGDYITCKIGDEPIFVIRTHSGKLQAMYNVCPHRGMRIVEGQGNCKHLLCPYHHWTYSLDGQLQGVPYAQECFPGLDKSSIALTKVQVDTWGGFIFVNLDPEAGPLRDYLAGVPEHMQQYSQPWEEMRATHGATFEVPFNWKILLENYIDAYHIPMVHSPTLGGRFEMPGFVGGCMSGMHTLQYYDYLVPRERTYISWIFPNTTILTLDEYVLVWQVNPVNPEFTVIEKFLLQTPAQIEKFPMKSEEIISKQFRMVFEEDIPFCRTLQEQVKSRAYNGKQKLAKGPEDGVLYFRKALLQVMKNS